MKRENSYVEIRIPFSSAAFCNAAGTSGSGPPVHASGSRRNVTQLHPPPVRVKSKSRPGTPEVSRASSVRSLPGKPKTGISKEKLQKPPPTKKDKVQEVQESQEDLTKNIHGGTFRKETYCPPGCDLSETETETPTKKTDRSQSYSPAPTKSQDRKLNAKSSKEKQRSVSTPTRSERRRSSWGESKSPDNSRSTRSQSKSPSRAKLSISRPSRSEGPKYARPNSGDYEDDGFTSSPVSNSDFRAADKNSKTSPEASVSRDSEVNKSRGRNSVLSNQSSNRTEGSFSKDSTVNKYNNSKPKEAKRNSKIKRQSISSKTKMALVDSDEEKGSDSDVKLTKSDTSFDFRAKSKKPKASLIPKRNSKQKSDRRRSGSSKNPSYDGEADDEGDEVSLGAHSIDNKERDDDVDQKGHDKDPLSHKKVQKFLLSNPVFLNTFVEEHVDGATLHQWVQQKCCGNSEQAKAYKNAKMKHKAEKREAKKSRKTSGADDVDGSNEKGNDEDGHRDNDESDGGGGPEKLQTLNFKLDQIPGCPSQGVPRAMTDEEIRRFKKIYGIDLRSGASNRRSNGGAHVCQARVEIPSCSPRPTGSVKCPAFKQYMEAHQRHSGNNPGCDCAKCQKQCFSQKPPT